MFFTVIEMLKKCKDFKMNKLICSFLNCSIIQSLYCIEWTKKKINYSDLEINEPVYLND